MYIDILTILGGIGLFLVGMILLTDGLRALAGDSVRLFLARYTKTPLSGAISGAVTTALIQSSSATTVTAVGFVGAGLLTFSQALGVIFGANVGTTLTGWLVALLGFKVKLGLLAYPLVFIGICARLFTRGKLAKAGWALVGFSLLFIGISTMQMGAAAFEGAVTPASFPPDTFVGRLQLVFIGMLVTIVTQSSSAGVATAMVALATGSISFTQAAALVIGMDVGTTFTAALATVGGSTSMRQTGYAHVIYNLMTGVMAIFLLGFIGPFLAQSIGAQGDAQVALAVFHSFFNLLGVLLILPFAGWFAAFIERLVPSDKTNLAEDRLDRQLLSVPDVAIDAAYAALKDIAGNMIALLTSQMQGTVERQSVSKELASLSHQLVKAREFVFAVQTSSDQKFYARHIALTHAVDHLRRLSRRCHQFNSTESNGSFVELEGLKLALIEGGQDCSADKFGAEAEAKTRFVHQEISKEGDRIRRSVARLASKSEDHSKELIETLDAILWAQRVAYHLWRINVYLQDELGQKVLRHIVR